MEHNLPAAASPRVMVRGCANAGKTSLCLEHVRDLVAQGAEPASILVLTASRPAASDLRRALGEGFEAVTVSCAMDFELELLASPAAYALTGRRPRVLADFEWDILLEDLRADAIPTKNLKGMLGFFQRSWTELADDDMDSFIIDPCENMALTAIKRHLGAYEAMHATEVSNLAVNYLRAVPAPDETRLLAHVAVDDYQSLNRASQLLVELLAPETLWVFADPCSAPRAADPFPYLKGVEEFVERNPEAALVELDPPADGGVRAAAWALVSSGYTEALTPGVHESTGPEAVEETYEVPRGEKPVEGVSAQVYNDPKSELDAVAAQVKALLDAGAAPSSIAVAVPNRNWLRGVRSSLKALGVKTQALESRQPLGGDHRSLSACGTSRMFAALALLADPADPMAWRDWGAFGDYVGNSNAFRVLEQVAREQGIGLVDALDLLERGEVEQLAAKPLVESYRQGRQMIAELAELRGVELVATLAAGLSLDGVPPVFAAARAAAGPAATAAQIYAELCRLVFAPTLGGDEAGVRVVEYSRMAGLKAEHLFVAGFMNGWLPRHAYFDTAEAYFPERRRMDREGRHATYALAGCATTSLVASGFTTCDLELAEKLKLKGYRVFAGPDATRLTKVRPSLFLDYALDVWGLPATCEREH
jgi:hypothetical protein